MKRIEGVAALLFVLAALVPPATAQLPSVGVSDDTGLQRLANASALPLNVSAQARSAGGGSVEIDLDGPADGRTAQAMQGQATPVRSIPRLEDSGFALSAAVGAAVGVGLVAYFWNSIKYALAVGLAMPLFSRIDHNRILDNEHRNRVHEAVCRNPGITIKEIKDLLGIGWGTTVYHLKRLEDERLVVSERHRQFRRYYENGGGIVNDAKQAFAELKNPTAQRLANELVARPGSMQKELCQALGISAPLAHKHLTRLEEAELLTKQREWKAVKYFPTPRLEELVAAPAGGVPIPA